MAYDGRAMRLALQQFEEDRQRRQAQYQERRERIFARQPRLREVDAQLREMSRYYGYKEKEFRDMLEKNGGMDDLQLDLMNAKVLNLLAEAAVK